MAVTLEIPQDKLSKFLDTASEAEVKKLYKLMDKFKDLNNHRAYELWFPDTGPLSRDKYVKHLQFFRAGAEFRERLFLSANRVGKTLAGAYEVALHLTGLYPDWWEGRRFEKPVDFWAAGDTNQTTRDVIQKELFGPPGAIGTGMIPGDLIIETRPKSGIPDGLESARVKHVTKGGESYIGLKSYDQGRRSFQGTAKDGIWCDEEPKLDIMSECLLRTMTTGGILMLTFTPLLGLSDVVMSYLPGGKIMERSSGSKHVTMATWDDAPHLDEATKKELWESIPPYQRDARSKGIPQLGSGAIYPVNEQDILVEAFEIPEWWPKVYGLDVGWNKTACLWAAYDRESDTYYIYDEYYRGQAEPASHAAAINARGSWIPGVIDPASNSSNQIDGKKLLPIYSELLGHNVYPADNAVEAGLYKTLTRLTTSRLKVFSHLQHFLSEYRIYRRDENGKVIKENDHLMDCMRYIIMSGDAVRKMAPDPDADYYTVGNIVSNQGRSAVGGY